VLAAALPSARYLSRVPSEVRYQPSLFGRPESFFDPTFSSLQHISLDETAWIDLVPGWVTGADRLFEEVLHTRTWGQRSRWMYDHRVLEPRLTSHWTLASGEALAPPLVERLRQALSSRYGVVFDSAGFNLYRDGGDGVAWHRDKIRKEIALPVVPLLSLGEPRKLVFRPRGGGPSRAFPIGHGDLLVTGGATQRTWEHAVLKVVRAGARISIAFRYGLDARGYGSDAPGVQAPGWPAHRTPRSAK
jgi:alkylated DNA repair dioxygenase AlkB